MGLMERVSKLIHADLDALVDGSDEPEQVISQVVLDMQNQLMQLKTQTAVASGHQRVLADKLQQKRSSASEWLRKAESAAQEKNDELARVSLKHHQEYESKASQITEEMKRYQAEVENLTYLLQKLEQKMGEAQKRGALLHVRRRLAPSTREGMRGAPTGENPREIRRAEDEDPGEASKSARIDKVLSELKGRVTR